MGRGNEEGAGVLELARSDVRWRVGAFGRGGWSETSRQRDVGINATPMGNG